MSFRAWSYILGVLAAAVALLAVSAATISDSTSQWISFIVLTLLATLAQLFKAEAPNNQTYFATPVFLFAGALMLHPFLFGWLVIISYSVEWIKERVTRSPHLRNWYIQPFNIATHILAGFVASVVSATITASYAEQLPLWVMSILAVFSVIVAAVTYAMLNHALVGLALVLARKVSWRESGILDGETLLTELILLLLGSTLVVLWRVDPWLVVPALSPLVLIYRALTVPQLKKEAQTDGKTGLLTAATSAHCTQVRWIELSASTDHSRSSWLILTCSGMSIIHTAIWRETPCWPGSGESYVKLFANMILPVALVVKSSPYSCPRSHLKMHTQWPTG